MKQKKKILKKFIALILVLALAIVATEYSCNKPQVERTAAHRELAPGEGVIILNEGVPLSGLNEASLCIMLFNAINQYRTADGRSPLLWSNELAAAAEIRAEEATRLWSHTRPNGQDYYTVNPSVVYGENLAKGYGTAEATLQAWKDSPTHNDNLLYPEYKYLALAECNGVISAEFCY